MDHIYTVLPNFIFINIHHMMIYVTMMHMAVYFTWWLFFNTSTIYYE